MVCLDAGGGRGGMERPRGRGEGRSGGRGYGFDHAPPPHLDGPPGGYRGPPGGGPPEGPPGRWADNAEYSHNPPGALDRAFRSKKTPQQVYGYRTDYKKPPVKKRFVNLSVVLDFSPGVFI